MELRGQDKRIAGGGGVGIPSNFTYGFTSIISATGGGGGGGDQRRRDGNNNNNNSTAGNGAVSSALNPSQTLDHQFHNLLHQQNHNRPSSSSISPQPQVPQSSREALRDEDSDSDPHDPDPVPATVSTAVDKSETTTPPTPTIRYKECLKNHAASIGGHVVDGCGEFMPSSTEEGTPGALKCAACDCHRSFHRKEVQGEVSQSVTKCYFCYNRNNKTDTKTRVLPPPLPHGPPPPPSTTIQHHQKFSSKLPNSHQGGLNQPIMMAFGGGGGTDQSSSEEFNVYQSNVGPGHHHQHPSLQPGQPYTISSSSSKKRFRTKFSQEQKEKMSELAERIGWRLTKEDEAAVQQFCVEVGVKRQVLKVWMHNNKHISMKKKSDEEEL